MLKDCCIDNYKGRDGSFLLMLRQSIWNRSVRDYLLTEDGYKETSDGKRNREHSSFFEMTGGKGVLSVLSVHRILNSTGKNADSKAARQLCDTQDFRELCRIFGERFAGVSAFEIKYELSFCSVSGNDRRGFTADNMLTYMRVEITCEKSFGEDRTAFFEIVRYRGGDNFELYWDGFPDVLTRFSDGHSAGCNVFMRGLIIYNIQTDGVSEGEQFALILPVITAFSRIAAAQFDYIIPDEEQMPGAAAESDGRVIWADPDGEIRFSAPGEGIGAWERYYGGFAGEGQKALVRRVLSQRPGETLILSEDAETEGLSCFLEKQRLVYKKTVQL